MPLWRSIVTEEGLTMQLDRGGSQQPRHAIAKVSQAAVL